MSQIEQDALARKVIAVFRRYGMEGATAMIETLLAELRELMTVSKASETKP